MKDINYYISQSVRTDLTQDAYLEASKRAARLIRLQHAVTGLHTEAGELSDALKKHIYYNKEVDAVNIKEEIGDVFWYAWLALDELSKLYGFDPEDVLETNLIKLRARYPEKFTEDAAVNRDLAAEREILESGSSS